MSDVKPVGWREFNDVSATVKAVVRVIAVSTKLELQQKRNVSLWCVCHYDDSRPSVVRRIVTKPSPIGNSLSVMFTYHSRICIYKVAASVRLCVCVPDFGKTCRSISVKRFMVHRGHT